MKLNKILIISLILITCLGFLTAVSAEDSSDVDIAGNEIEDVSENGDYLSSDDSLDELSSDCCEVGDTSDDSVHYVAPDPENPNQVQAPTVQPVIDAAKPGDTIILNGTFVHCHFMINKTLTILATPGSSVGVCPHHTHMMRYGEGPETHGVFYISPEAKGTVIADLSFTNDFYTIATDVYNPFGVFVDADDVCVKNLTFDWVGTKSSDSKFNPDDFRFDAVILNNTHNTTIKNFVIGNLHSFITSVNASNINTANISVVEPKKIEDSNITVNDLKISAGDSGNLEITLKDKNNVPISSRDINIIINGVFQVVKTDENGIARLPVKYSNAGTYYVAAAFAGDDDYRASFGNAKITVTKKAATLTVSKDTLKVKKSKTIKVTLKSSNTLISNKKVTFKVNGKTFSAKTNSKGVASIKVKVTKKGKLSYTAAFAGDNVYNAVVKTGKITVK